MSILKATDVSIRYLTGDFKDIGFKEYVMRNLKGNYTVNEFWADRHVSFELERGDMLGIIGTNGAGKSTLLKAVSGIMIPTEGKMEINGRIAALLELASGFDDDLTVRENTYLRGAMLGYTRKFMEKRYEEIIEFAELENFQDRTFKQLSSGMKSRLAFSIACLVSPDIIILDEVLSVGDGAFQTKSANRMKAILASGVTGILVSHSIEQIRQTCNKILWLDHGLQVGFGDNVEAFCNAYEMFLKGHNLPKDEYEILELSTLFKAECEKQQKSSLEENVAKERRNLLNVIGTNQEYSRCFYEIFKQYDDNSNFARIDIRNESKNNTDILILNNSDTESKETTPKWFQGYGIGHILESRSGEMEFCLKCIGDGCLKIILRSVDVSDVDNNRVPIWIKFDSFSINNEDVINESVYVWHDQPYIYTTNVKDGQIINAKFSWSKGNI